ncbi:MAG: PDZ domain-containing protein [Flavobacteriales bacterium]|nr:PDZ domain-containing protein [Flavobacteriales bacterium]
MNYLTHHLAKELAFVAILLMGIIAIAHAQDSEKQKKVKVQIEVTEDGKTTTSIQEIELDLENLERQMDDMLEEIEMVLEEAVGDLEAADIEVIINKRRAEESEFYAPHYRQHMRSVRAPRPPRPPRAHGYAYHFETEGEPRAFLGVVTVQTENSEDASTSEPGARITRVVEGSAAEEAGLQDGDVILEIDGEKVSNHKEVAAAIKAHQIDEEISIRYQRGEKKEKTRATLRSYEAMDVFERMGDGDDVQFFGPKKMHKAMKWTTDLEERKVFLGIEGASGEEGGVRISKVFEASTAESIGLAEGDVVRTVNGASINDISELVSVLNEMEAGEVVEVTFEREGAQQEASGEIKSFPEEMKREFHMEFDDLDEMEELEALESIFVSDHLRDIEKSFVFRFEMEDVEPQEIRALNKKSGASLDENNSLALDRFMISPNPSDGLFVIDGLPQSDDDVHITVLDANGGQVLEKSLKIGAEGLLTRIDLTDQASGIYFISVQQNGKGKVSRVVKQ